MRNRPKALIDARQTDNWKQKTRGDTTDYHLQSRDALECNRHWGGVIQSSPTRWHVLFSVLVSADSINRRGGGGGGGGVGSCSPPCFPPFLSFSFPFARISRMSAVRPFLASLLAIARAGLRFILMAYPPWGHVSRRVLIALPISTRARSRTTPPPIGTHVTNY